jgi:hypothetical protein
MLPRRLILGIRRILGASPACDELEHDRRREFVMCLTPALQRFEYVDGVPATRGLRGRRRRETWRSKSTGGGGVCMVTTSSSRVIVAVNLWQSHGKKIKLRHTHSFSKVLHQQNRHPRDPTERRRTRRLRSTCIVPSHRRPAQIDYRIKVVK